MFFPSNEETLEKTKKIAGRFPAGGDSGERAELCHAAEEGSPTT